MVVIGLSGFIGSGKSTVSDYLVNEHGFSRLSFAAPLKDITAIVFGWDRKKLEGTTPEDRVWREQKDEYWSTVFNRPVTARWALQYMGTEVFRNSLHQNIWAEITANKIRNLPSNAKVVIDDVRFVNEQKAIASLGGKLWTIIRSPFPTPEHQALWSAVETNLIHEYTTNHPITLHPSEWNWLQGVVDYDGVINNNGTLDVLYYQVNALLPF